MRLLLPDDLKRMKLGCRIHAGAKTVPEKIAASMARILPAWSRIIDAPRVEGFNDTIGDCVETAGFNAVQTLLSRAGNKTPISNNLVPSVYAAVTGYNPSDPASDQGTDPEVFFTWWAKKAVAGYKIASLTRLDPKGEDGIRQCIVNDGGVFLCVELAIEQQNEIVWTANGTPGSWGGHAVWCDGFEAELTFATSWGQVKPIDRSYFEQGFVVAAYGFKLVVA